MVNQPINFNDVIVRFYNGDDYVIHKTTGKRFTVNVKMKKLPDGFALQTLDTWSWSEAA
ncbi:YorC [Bacillus atrophaeus UCMB-5137]|nr:YorC [Bacillus atrophaeus UCMB-5137]